MDIRNFRAGDETAQVDIYNQAAGALPKFKPATLQEVQRRVRGRDFEPRLRFYAQDAGKVVAYCTANGNGRVSCPWCLPGFERCAKPLFERALQALKDRDVRLVFAAYRGDWPSVHDFFLKNGFTLAREMVNFAIDLIDMPTPSARASAGITPIEPADVPALFALAPKALRVVSHEGLHEHLFKNPYFTPDHVFALRNKSGEAVAAGILIKDPSFADPYAVDSAMPCFRLGAFGTEGMQAKRIKGLFSFLAREDADLYSLAMSLMGHAAFRLRDRDDITALAGQVANDMPMFLNFYQRNFKKQGSFPVFEFKVTN